jgi:hypothetical protein
MSGEDAGTPQDAASGAGYVNPSGAGFTLVAAVLLLVGTLLPIHARFPIDFSHNSLITSGRWWVTVIAVAMGVNATYMILRPRADDRNRAWAAFAGSLTGLIVGIWGFTQGFQQVTLGSSQRVLPPGLVIIQAHAGIGVYVVLIAGALGLTGSVLMLRDRDWKLIRTSADVKKCPDCAELILVDARVCKHCGFRYPDGYGPARNRDGTPDCQDRRLNGG